MWRWLFCCLILINPSEYGLFAAGYNGYKMIPACKISNAPPSNVTHYIAIIDQAVGTLYEYAHIYLFQQLFCGLNDARSDNTGVQFFAWHIDTELGECIVFETNDTMTNLRGTFDDLYTIPPSPTGTTLCKKLEVAKKCASSIPHDQKVEIGVPLLLHETLGNCDIQNALGFANQKVSIFWTNDYYKPRKLPSLSSNVEFVFFGASHDFLPQETWTPNEDMVNALKNGKSDMIKSLHLRFQKMIGINKKDIGEGFERTRPTTTATYSPSKSTTAKILNAGLNILPFFQPKHVKVQQSTTISAPLEIQEKVDHSVIGDTLPLVVRGKLDLGKRLDRKNPSQQQKDNVSDITKYSSTVQSGKFSLLTTPPPPKEATKAKEEQGFFEAFGDAFGNRKYGALYFFLGLVGLVLLAILSLFVIWCCCLRGSTKGKYEVLKKETEPLSAVPDPEAGIAYPRGSDESNEQPLLKSSISRESIKAKTENRPKGIYDDAFGTPQQSTPASPLGNQTSPAAIVPQLYSPAPLTMYSQTSEIADTHQLIFQTERDETQTIPELKVPSDEK